MLVVSAESLWLLVASPLGSSAPYPSVGALPTRAPADAGATVRGYAGQDGSVPDAINNSTEFGRIGPGLIVKSFTPGCGQGNAPVPCAEEATTSN